MPTAPRRFYRPRASSVRFLARQTSATAAWLALNKSCGATGSEFASGLGGSRDDEDFHWQRWPLRVCREQKGCTQFDCGGDH